MVFEGCSRSWGYIVHALLYIFFHVRSHTSQVRERNQNTIFTIECLPHLLLLSASKGRLNNRMTEHVLPVSGQQGKYVGHEDSRISREIAKEEFENHVSTAPSKYRCVERVHV